MEEENRKINKLNAQIILREDKECLKRFKERKNNQEK